MKFQGVGVALVTPFDNNNTIDYTALENIINFNIEGGVDFLVCMGTTGETPTLSANERAELLTKTAQIIDSRVPLVLGLGGNNTAEVAEAVKNISTDIVDAILTVCPYYNKPSQEGMYKHFEAIAQASKVPLILYNVPGRTSSNILPETVLRLAKNHDNIVAVKEASGNLQQIMQIVKNKPDGFTVLSGDDDLVLPELAMGIDGVISVVANAFPAEFSELVHAGMEGHYDRVRDLHYSLLEMIWMLFLEGNPAGVKYVMHKRGLCQPYVRLPLVGISEKLATDMDKQLAQLI